MKIIIIDDDPLVSSALKTILESDPEITVDAVGRDGCEALALYRTHKPDILLLDIRMKNVSGLTAGEAVLGEFPDARVLFLTTFSDDEYIIHALRIGARGYLLKQDFDSIAPALKAVMTGQSVFGEEIVSRIPLMSRTPDKPDSDAFSELTEKELDILRLLGEGMSNKEISEKLYIGEGTVRNLVSAMLDKLNLKSRTQLAVFYLKHS
ncbi:MAG: response regulator transcription factor [Oscillospiraceae bacterium]|nr:response regulator transcription factor [Clostridiales bacterium]MDD4095993.1 response regulator transcription factor [Oscillospiraceae bacterium]